MSNELRTIVAHTTNLSILRAMRETLVAEGVSEDFIREAYSAASPTWKTKIERKFPSLFRTNPYVKLLKGESTTESFTLSRGWNKVSTGSDLSMIVGDGLAPAGMDNAVIMFKSDAEDIELVTGVSHGYPYVAIKKKTS